MASGEYDDFYGYYKPFVTAFVARRVETDAVADLVAEVFTVAWRRRDIVPADALPWLYRTARNLVGNRYRSRDRLAALEGKLRSVPTEPVQDVAEASAERRRLFDAFAALSDDDRELLLLVAWEGLAVPDIAEVMNLSPGATSVRLHRARNRFEEAMGIDSDQRVDPIDITTGDEASKGQHQ